jgi:hypothetical protein
MAGGGRLVTFGCPDPADGDRLRKLVGSRVR